MDEYIKVFDRVNTFNDIVFEFETIRFKIYDKYKMVRFIQSLSSEKLSLMKYCRYRQLGRVVKKNNKMVMRCSKVENQNDAKYKDHDDVTSELNRNNASLAMGDDSIFLKI